MELPALISTLRTALESDTVHLLRERLDDVHPADLASALVKLYQDNASTLTPDPLYARFYYSHPPAAERLERLPA